MQAMIFDLDGTLVQTEKLKALSYAQAAVELCPYSLEESDVIEGFKDVVGLSRREVATSLVERFDLEEKANELMADFEVSTPWQAYVQRRLQIYENLLSDPDTIADNQWSHNIELLNEARRRCRYVGLATMSSCQQVQRVLSILNLTEKFDFVASSDDVEQGKPDPEIYLLVANEFALSPADCLVIEDSPSGVEAAQAAGMTVIAVSTPFTRQRLYESGLLPDDLIVDDPEMVTAVVRTIIEEPRDDESTKTRK